MMDVKQRIEDVQRRIALATEKAGRPPSSVRLVAVSKTKSVQEIFAAYDAGQRVFGENYAQEMAAKAGELSGLDIEWHFIGHLQKNKAKLVAPIAACIETLDSIELAEAIGRRATRRIPCFIEVNIGGEGSKSGIGASGVLSLAQKIIALPNLKLEGLMVIPPYDPDPEFGRPYFKRLKGLLSNLNDAVKLEQPLCGLSMGMSHDFEVAIEEGATIVRIGTAIFGERHY